MSARVYFMKTANGCKDVSFMSLQDEQCILYLDPPPVIKFQDFFSFLRSLKKEFAFKVNLHILIFS